MRPLIGVPLEAACEALAACPPGRAGRPSIPRALLDARGAENDAAARRARGRRSRPGARWPRRRRQREDPAGRGRCARTRRPRRRRQRSAGSTPGREGCGAARPRALAHVGDHPADIVGAHAAKAVADWRHDRLPRRRRAEGRGSRRRARRICSTFRTGSTSTCSTRGWPPLKERAARVRARSSSRSPAGQTRRSSLRRPYARSAQTGCWPRPLCLRRCRDENSWRRAAFAEELGVRHLAPRTDEMSRPGYRANDGDRCYFCKAELLDVLAPTGRAARALPRRHRDQRRRRGRRLPPGHPGRRRTRCRSTPLLDAGLTKAQVREASRRWGLPTWDKPAAACLSSRVAYGMEITPARLARVDRAEAALRTVLRRGGRRLCAICACATSATLPGSRSTVTWSTRSTHCRPYSPRSATSGFADRRRRPVGFRSGAMNELLPEPARFR